MREALSAVVLASGKGSRLGELTKDTPKPLLEFGGKPYLQHLTDWLLASGIDDVVVTAHTHHEQIEDFIDGQYDDRVRAVVEPSLESTIQSSEYGLRQTNHETSLLLTADNIWRISVRAIMRTHRDSGALATAMVTANPNVPNAGKVRVSESEDRILEMWPSNTLENKLTATRAASTMGLYVVSRTALLGAIGPTDTSIEREPMNRLTPEVAAHWNEGYFFDFGTPEKYAYLRENPHAITTNLQ